MSPLRTLSVPSSAVSGNSVAGRWGPTKPTALDHRGFISSMASLPTGGDDAHLPRAYNWRGTVQGEADISLLSSLPQ